MARLLQDKMEDLAILHVAKWSPQFSFGGGCDDKLEESHSDKEASTECRLAGGMAKWLPPNNGESRNLINTRTGVA